MARRLDTPDGRYSHDDVLAKLQSGVYRTHPRVELRDPTGGIEERALDARRAVVAYDLDRAVVGSLDVVLSVDERLRDRPFQWDLWVWYGVGPMADGGIAEFPFGVFPWVQPQRLLTGRVADRLGGGELWRAQLGDRMVRLDSGGPGLETLEFKAGLDGDEGIRRILQRVGITDFSGVANVADTFDQTLGYNFLRASRLKKRKKSGKVEWVDLEGNPETYRLIADDVHEDFGLDRPFFDLTGIYQAQPARDYSAVPADHRYNDLGTGDQALLVSAGGLAVTPNIAPCVNRVLATAPVKDGEPLVVAATLDALLPAHPLAQRKIGFPIDAPLRLSGNSAHKNLNASAQRELLERASFWETAKIRTPINPRHTLRDVVDLQIGDNVTYGTQQLLREAGWTADLFAGTMDHDLRRLYRFVT